MRSPSSPPHLPLPFPISLFPFSIFLFPLSILFHLPIFLPLPIFPFPLHPFPSTHLSSPSPSSPYPFSSSSPLSFSTYPSPSSPFCLPIPSLFSIFLSPSFQLFLFSILPAFALSYPFRSFLPFRTVADFPLRRSPLESSWRSGYDPKCLTRRFRDYVACRGSETSAFPRWALSARVVSRVLKRSSEFQGESCECHSNMLSIMVFPVKMMFKLPWWFLSAMEVFGAVKIWSFEPKCIWL